MSSPQSQASASAAQKYGGLQDAYMGLGIQSLNAQQNRLSQGLAEGGEIPGQARAFDVQRALGTDMGARNQLMEIGGQMGAQKGAAAGGNQAANLSGADYGAKLAQYLSNSRVSQGAAGLEQMGKLMGMQLGTAQQAGSASVGAAGRQLGAISMMPKVNQTYADILGVANLGLAGYGAYAGAQNTPVGGAGNTVGDITSMGPPSWLATNPNDTSAQWRL